MSLASRKDRALPCPRIEALKAMLWLIPGRVGEVPLKGRHLGQAQYASLYPFRCLMPRHEIKPLRGN